MDKSILIKTRTEYIEKLKKELLGPGSEFITTDIEHEIISAPANARYSVGVLHPCGEQFNADNDENQTEGSEDDNSTDIDQGEENDIDGLEKASDSGASSSENIEDNLDEEIGMALQNKPSSMGLTFFAKGNSNFVKCNVSFATYRSTRVSDCKVKFERPSNDYQIPMSVSQKVDYDEDNCILILKSGLKLNDYFSMRRNDEIDDWIAPALYALANQCKGYIREPHSVDLELDFSSSNYIDNNQSLDETCAKVTAIRKKVMDDVYSITIMLVNDNNRDSSSKDYLFQSVITVNSDNNDFSFFDFSSTINMEALSDEEKSLELQYRNKKKYATGLGVSTVWDIDNSGNGKICTEYFPHIEVPSMDFNLPDNATIDKNVLSMKFLSDLTYVDKSIKISILNDFINLYNTWIDGIESNIEMLDEKFHYIAKKNISACKVSFDRMKKGLSVLEENEDAWSAFELANRAMFMQRAHIKLSEKMADKEVYDGDEDIERYLDIDYDEVDIEGSEQYIEDYYSWRPFQLAFLLLSVDSIVNDNSDDKDIVDLIWFPTGGGKTEAYLGLTAFTIFYRRLAHPGKCNGTSVIMRYTLRLLTAQQFTRASTLICACEYIRRDCADRRPIYKKYPLGDEKITIGLWIGHEHTPNRNAVAEECIKELNRASNSYTTEKYEKFQVLKCPWCSTKLTRPFNDRKHIYGYHMEKGHFTMNCTQQDCEYNDQLPIQVVDEELYSNPPTLLFATVDKFAMMPWNEKIGAFFGIYSDNRPPELIIQDELHLISGPLGTMTGLYESAIDYLCEQKGVKTKIIASTATIRRAAEQCVALYDRKVAQFPSPGIDSDDSFFAKEKTIDYSKNEYGRMYVGIMPSGKTKATMEVRSIAAMAHIVNNFSIEDSYKDKFWTNTVYFNSLNELGKCRTLAEDDIRNQMKVISNRKCEKIRYLSHPDELTSRVSTSVLNETLNKIEKVTYSKDNIEAKRRATDILLATNMISVGIDVARLNTMLLVGQPKLTSEYIQASSRIGRSYPGVAFVLYDGTKSRDRSHYEQFKSYHEAFYKNVEPTSVTPFAKPARDRALHAVVITILRYLNPELREESAASNFETQKYSNQIESITNYLIDRCKHINDSIDPNMEDDSDDLKNEIEQLLSDWQNEAKLYGDNKFYYGSNFMFNKKPKDDEGRLLKTFDLDNNDPANDTMTSMRNVDTEVTGQIIYWEN